MSNTKYLVAEARASANKWATVKQAADLLGAVVAEMVQAIAEADEEKLLRHKRRELENCYNSQFIPESLEIVCREYSGYKLADSFRELLHWFELMQGATTFERWSTYRKHFLVRRSYFHNHLVSSTSEANKYHQHFFKLYQQYQADMAKEDRKRTPRVAVPKAVRKEAIRNAIMPHTLVPQTVATCSNSNLYKLAKYHLGRNGTRELQYGFRLTYKIWSHAIAIRSLGRNWYVGSV